MAYEQADVFAATAEADTTLVGQLSLAPGGGSFRYSEAWLASANAYPLDPANLPLSPQLFRTQQRSGVFGVFADAAADDWGMRLLLLNHQHAPTNEVERLLLSNGKGVGCLRYSLARTRPKTAPPLADSSLLTRLAEVADRVERRELLAPAELALLEPGSSMGGARPKVSVQDGERTWLVKFSRSSDLVDMARLEYATMSFLRDVLHLRVGDVRLFELGPGKVAYGIRRFDCEPGRPVHFISAHSLFNVEAVRLIRDSRRNAYSYINLAGLLRKHAHDFRADCTELFRRMVVNIVFGNSDDHARNHALLFDINAQQWQLSPLYDVVPTIGTVLRKQALGVGIEGSDSTLTNALSLCSLFGLSTPQAQQLIDEIVALLPLWESHCAACWMTPQDIVLSRRSFLLAS
jgi:serine/threonine-protein kinase HipA